MNPDTDRKLCHWIAAVIMVRDHGYSAESATALAEHIIQELRLRREDTPGFYIDTWQSERTVHKKVYRYITDWRTE